TFFTAGWLALGLQSSGYLAETFRTGIEGVPRGQREAAFSAGMSPTQTFGRIVMPQVALTTAPSIVNQFTVIVKSSTLVSVITVPDVHQPLRLRHEVRHGDHRAGPHVAIAAAGERLVRTDRDFDRDGGAVHFARVRRVVRGQVSVRLS